MGLNVLIHEYRVEAVAGPAVRRDRQKLAVEHGKIVEDLRATVPHLDIEVGVSEDELTRTFNVLGVTKQTRMNVGAMATASHDRLDAKGIEWGGPGIAQPG